MSIEQTSTFAEPVTDSVQEDSLSVKQGRWGSRLRVALYSLVALMLVGHLTVQANPGVVAYAAKIPFVASLIGEQSIFEQSGGQAHSACHLKNATAESAAGATCCSASESSCCSASAAVDVAVGVEAAACPIDGCPADVATVAAGACPLCTTASDVSAASDVQAADAGLVEVITEAVIEETVNAEASEPGIESPAETDEVAADVESL